MEKQTEKIKCLLATCKDFDLFTAFKKFDSQEIGSINLDEFISGIIYFTRLEYNRVLRE